MGDYDVPFERHVNVGELLSKMHTKTDKKLIDNDEDENNVDYLEDNSVKKRKRKRGKAVWCNFWFLSLFQERFICKYKAEQLSSSCFQILFSVSDVTLQSMKEMSSVGDANDTLTSSFLSALKLLILKVLSTDIATVAETIIGIAVTPW